MRLPAATRTRPTMVRSSDDFPAPLRPVTAKTSPEATAKLTPANTSRPPRWQARFDADSRIKLISGAIGTRLSRIYRLFVVDLAHLRKSPYKPLVVRALLIGPAASASRRFSPARGARQGAGGGGRSGNQ